MAKLCFGCMKQKESSPVCEHCGFDETRENLPHQLPIGTLLQGQYLIGRVLGQGGFGITYIGWDQHLSVPVAIKEYYPGGVVQRHTRLGTEVLCGNGEAPEVFAKHRDRFLKEARTLAKLADIPEIVQIRGYFSANETAYIVMEYVHGITMKGYLKQLGRPMTEAEALRLMEPVLRGLQKVHEQNLIHRDISPDNIMLPAGGGVKLIDFGTVRYTDASGASRSTEAVLKPGFAPMEQYNTRGNLGTWTDVYAICATIHYLLTGRVPPDVHERMDNGEELALLRSNPEISPGLIRTLEDGMKIRYTERIQNIGQLYDRLYHPAEEKQVPAETKAAPGKKKSRRPWLMGAAAAAVAAVLAVSLLPKGQAQAPVRSEPPREATEAATEDSRETAYAYGIELLELGRYDEAWEVFSALGDYKDSQWMAQNAVDRRDYAAAEALLREGKSFEAAKAFYALGDFADAREQCFAIWDTIAVRDTIAAGYGHTVGVKTDGTVLATGENNEGESDVQSWTDIIAVSASWYHTVGLRADGTVVAVGNNDYGQCEVSSWQDIVAISAADNHTVGLKADGTVVAVGYSGEDDANPSNRTAVDGWVDIVAVSAGNHYTMGLRADGTVLITRSPNLEENDVASWRDVHAISAANWHGAALLADGTAVATGTNKWHQCDVSGWTDLEMIRGGFHHTVGLKEDGTVVAVGSNGDYFGSPMGQLNVSGWQDIVQVTAGGYHTIGLRSNGTVVATGINYSGQCDVFHWCDIRVPE